MLAKLPAGQIGNSQFCKDTLNYKHILEVFLLKDSLSTVQAVQQQAALERNAGS